MIGLTVRQSEALRYITAYLEKSGGIAPTFQEMKEALGFASKNSVWRLMDALEERGHIVRLKHRARAMKVVTPEIKAPEPEIIVLPPEPIEQRIRSAGEDEFKLIVKAVSDELTRRTNLGFASVSVGDPTVSPKTFDDPSGFVVSNHK